MHANDKAQYGRKFLVGLTVPAVMALTTAASGADVEVQVSPPGPPVIVQPAPPATVIQPGSGSVVVQPMTQTMLADTIRAREVRAGAIYANKINARQVQGTIHQTRKIDIGAGKADVRAPMVTASVIYADEIRADSVVANDIFVRELAHD